MEEAVHLCPHLHHPAGCRPSAVCLAGAEVASAHARLRSLSYNSRKDNTNVSVELPNSSPHLFCHCRTVTTFLLVIVIISAFQGSGFTPLGLETTEPSRGSLHTQVLYNVMPSILRTQQSLVFGLSGTNCRLYHMPVFKL